MMNGSEWELILGDETTSCGNWLVSCTTLVKLSKCVSGQMHCPKLISVSAPGGSCAMAVDQMLVYLSKDQELLKMQTKHKVDDLSVLDGGYMVMGLSNGTLTIGVMETDGDAGSIKFVIKSSQKVAQCDATMDQAFKRIIFRLTDDQVGQVIALTSTGSLIVVSNIKLMEGDMNVLNASVKTVSVSRDTIDCVNCGDYFVLLGQGDSTISVYSLEEDQLVLNDGACQYKDKRMTGIWACGSNMLFTMDSDSMLYLWNLTVCVVVESFSLKDGTNGHAIMDLRVNHSQEATAAFDLSSVGAAVLCDDFLRMLEIPSLACSFEQEVGNNHIVFSKSPLLQDDIYVAQCAIEHDEDDDETCLDIKFLSYAETDPKQRLDKLLARQQFDDAQRLIETYKIEFNITPYLVQQRMFNALPALSETQDLLKTCRKQIDTCKSTSEVDCDDLVTGVSSELHALKYRLDAFVRVFGEEAYSPSEWQQFQHADILDVAITLFTSQKFVQAFDLWHYFQLDLIARLKPGMVGKILRSLSATSAATVTSPAVWNKVLDWLVGDIVPYLVWSEPLADEMVSIVQWILGLVELMESQQTDWPSNGIAACDRMLKCLQANTLNPLDEEVGLWNDKMAPCQNDLIQALQDTLVAMETIEIVKTRFHCHLSLDIVRKETKDSLVYRMLDKVKVVESLPMVLKTQILPYVEYNNIRADVIFASYVKDIMQRVSHQPFDDASWKTKVQAIIDVIQAPKEKVLSVLNLVEHSSLPFADFVEDLVTSVLESIKHPLTATLQTRWQTLQASNLLCLYGEEPFSVTPNKALEVARFFILQDRASSMSDAKKLLQAVGVEGEEALAEYQAMFYIEKNRLPDLMHFLKSLPTSCAKSCAKWCLGMGEMNMTAFRHPQPAVEKAYSELRIRFFQAGILSASVLKYDIGLEDHLELEEIKMVASKVQSALTLENLYDIGLDRFDLEDEETCLGIFKKQLEDEEHKEAVLLRIAELLGLSRETALCCMLEHAALGGSMETVCHLTEALCHCLNLSRSSCVYNTAVRLAGLEQPWFLTPARNLASHALINCRRDEITSRLKLSQEITLLERVHSQCQDKGKGASDDLVDLPQALDTMDWGGMETDENKEDWFGPCYSQVKMPLTHSHLQDAYNVLGPTKKVPVCEMRPAVTELTSQLVSFGHDELTLDILNRVQHQAQQARQQDHDGECDAVNNQATKSLINKATIKVSARLLGKVIKQTPSDVGVCLPLALQLPQSHMVTLLNQEAKMSSSSSSVSVNHNRLKKFLEVVTAYGELHGNDDIVNRCLDLSRQEKWRNRLSKLGLSLGPSPSMKTILQAVTTLMLDNNSTFPLVQEFVLDMDLNWEAVQIEYQSTFCNVLTQAPVSPGAMDKARMILQSIDESSRLDAIEQALPTTSEYNYEVLQFLLEQKDAIENNRSNKKSLELLKLLKDYKRRFPPSSVEEDAVNINNSSHSSDVFSSFSSSFSSVSSVTTTSSAAATIATMAAWERQQQLVRLPFRLLQGKKMGKIMEVELTASTLPAWQLITSVLGSPKDRILIGLATKLVTSYIKPNSNGGGGGDYHMTNGSDDAVAPVEDNGVVTKEFENLLQEVGPILEQMERKECGVWLCQATADRLTRIGDKVRTLENGLNYARMWMQECDAFDDNDGGDGGGGGNNNWEDKKKAEKAAQVFESKIPALSTQWVLICAGLGSRKELMPLVNQPEQLIRHLYHLPLKTLGDIIRVRAHHNDNSNSDGFRLGKFADPEERTSSSSSYDEAVIHGVCEEIAKLHDLDLLTIQKALVDLWLTGSDPSSSSSLNDAAEHTMFNVTTDFNLGCDSVVNEEDSVPRIVSMLNSSNGPAHAEHLLEILFDDSGGGDGDGDVTIQQLQQNLTLNSRRTTILCLSKTGHASPELRQELNVLNQLISLQAFGVCFTPEMYGRVDKRPLLLRLWEKYKGRRSTGPLVARLCLDQSLGLGTATTNSPPSPSVPPQLWNSILLQMAKFGHTTGLRPVMMSLMQTRGLEKVRRTDGFIQAKKILE